MDKNRRKRSSTGKPLCHCEKRSDEAISGVDWQRLLRYARNDGAEMPQLNGYEPTKTDKIEIIKALQ